MQRARETRGDTAGSGARPKMTDVGRMAGVSAQTVSRFLSGKGYVGPDTRLRVQQAIDALGYRPNLIARNFHLARTDMIGVLMAGDFSFGSAQVLAGMSAGATDADVTIIVTHLEHGDGLQPHEVEKALERMLSMRVDGMVVPARIEGLDEIIHNTVHDEIPVVIISGRPRRYMDSAVADSYAAGSLVMEHLLALGHRRIAHLTGPPSSDESRERERAYFDAMVRASLPALPLIVGGDWTSQAGYTRGVSTDFDNITAVFAGNDELALGFMAAARERGLSAPGDFSIAGIDNMPEAQFFAPPLTTAKLDFAELGRGAFEMLRRRIELGERQPRLVIEPELVVRASTGPPRSER